MKLNIQRFSITNFQKTLWSAKIQTQLETITGLRKHSDYQFEGEVAMGKELKILGVTRPTIRKYVPGTPLTRESGTDSSQLLQINQYDYFDFEVEDIDKAQGQKGLMEALSSEATKGLADAADAYVASLTAGATYKNTSYAIAKSTIVAEVEKGFQQLYTNNCKVSDMFYLEISPKFFTNFRQALTELSTGNPDLIKKGAVGKYGNAEVYIENQLYDDETDKWCILRTPKAIAFAGQIDKLVPFTPEDSFTDAIKGLHVYGAKIVRPEQLYCILAH